MPKQKTVYTLFIAAPGDIVKEKEIIRTRVTEWNRLVGRRKNFEIQVTDWSETYPSHGAHPQEIINKQIFDDSDIVVGIFWTKFGTPTLVAGSGTEEEIERAIEMEKNLLLYFSNEKVSPATFNDEEYRRIKEFRKKHQENSLYRIYDSTDGFNELFLNNLHDFMNDLIEGKLKQAKAKVKTDSVPVVVEEDETGVTYESYRKIANRITTNFPSYWTKIFGTVDENLTASKGSKNEINKLHDTLSAWESTIVEYSEKLKNEFADLDDLTADELKNDIMPSELWTVGAGLKSYDEELRRFKQSYEATPGYKIKKTVSNIVEVIDTYVVNIPVNVQKGNIKKPASIGLDMLHPDETLLTGVIGKGIRSEILHKLSPEFFPLMTRRSVWGLYFLSDEASEFVVYKEKDGWVKTVHNWDYLYDYFTYYNHIIFDLFQDKVHKFNIQLKPELKYGYVNLFLVEIFKSNKDNIEELKAGREVST